jgi:hypothetical protein
MRKVTKVEREIEEEKPINFVISLEDEGDKTSSPFSLVKDGDEFVLQGDKMQRFCESELLAILKEIQKLNPKQTKK